MFIRTELLIGGRWRSPSGSRVAEVVSPSTEQVVGRVPASAPDDVDAAIALARRAFDNGPWPRMSVEQRADFLLRLGDVLLLRLEELVRLQVDEMGSPYSFMRAATQGVIAGIHHQVDIAASIPSREVRDGIVGKVVVLREPIGVVAGIIPWNAPIPLAFSKMLPALLTGCPIVLKPAAESPLSTYLLGEAAVEVGLPEGVLSIVPGGGQLGQYLVSHPGVDRVSFTGSSAAGSVVAARCGELLKSVTLELGGKSAAVVLDDADVDQTVPMLIESSMPNNGQVCYATSRILVPKSRAKEILERLVDALSQTKVGNPHEPDTQFGPLVSARQRERVEGYIRSGREQGATIVLGGGRPASLPVGWYVEPTIFAGVDNSMVIAQEEIFGPVVCVIAYGTDDEAVAIANDSSFGLGGAVYTADPERGLSVASRIQTGTCRVNEAPPAGGGGPFGGVKRSGLGRERSREGYESYYELKAIALPAGVVPSGTSAKAGA